MNKDFVSILDLMPGVFELTDMGIEAIFRTDRFRNNNSIFQYDVYIDEKGQKKLHFVDRQYEYGLARREVLPINEQEDLRYLEDGHAVYQEHHTPYVLDLAYDVPEILEIYYLRQSDYASFLPDEYINILENVYYYYVLAYVRSQDSRFMLDEKDYETDKETNHIYYYLNTQDKVFQLDPEDDTFKQTVIQTVCANAEKLEKNRKLKNSEKNELGFIFCPSKDLFDVMEYVSFLDENRFHTYAQEANARYIELSLLLPMMVLHTVTARERRLYTNSTYADYLNLSSRFPIGMNHQTNILPADYNLSDEFAKEKGLSEDGSMHIIAYKTAMLSSGGFMPGRKNHPLDDCINQVVYHRLHQQICSLLFGDKAVPMSIEHLDTFENETWSDNAQIKLALNASTLEWRKQG